MISEILRRTDAEMEAEALKLPLPKLMELDQDLKKIPVGAVVVRAFFGGLSRAVTRALEAHWRHQVQVQAALQCPMC